MNPSPLVTVPVPLPLSWTVSENWFGWFCVKVAVTDLAWSIVTTQLPVPVHPDPFQPVKPDPGEGLAVSVTEVPASYTAEHVAPQLMPDGVLLTLPLPVPPLVTESWNCCTKVAVTLRAALMVT
jgi:hypothetical protein